MFTFPFSIFSQARLLSKTVYSTNGTFTYTVPMTATFITVKQWAAGGGSAIVNGGGIGAGVGGASGYAECAIPVTGGESLTVFVPIGGYAIGAQGTPGGGLGGGGAPRTAGGGGGYASIQRSTTPLIVTGGGGGSGNNNGDPARSNGGANGGAGGTVGVAGSNGQGPTSPTPSGGSGGNAGSGGTGGTDGGNATTGTSGGSGSSLQGGNTNGGIIAAQSNGGGGGGGYFGGGAGGSYLDTGTHPGVIGGGGGGGGTCYTNAAGNILKFTATGSGTNPPNTTDSDYITGVGKSTLGSNGGPGLTVIVAYNGTPTNIIH